MKLLNVSEVTMSERSLSNQKVSLTVGAADSANMTTIFTSFLIDVFSKFMEETGRFYFFPLAAAGSMIQMILAWRQDGLDQGKNGALGKALVETIGFLGITTAVVGGFVAATLFATVAPILFTATVAFKSLYHAGTACYNWYKSATTSDPNQKAIYSATARANAVGAFAGTLATLAIGLVMIAAKPICAVLGVAAGLIGTVYSLYKRFTMPASKPSVAKKVDDTLKQPLLSNENDVSPSTKLHQTFSRTVSKDQPSLQSAANVASPSGPLFHKGVKIKLDSEKNKQYERLLPSRTM